MVKESLLWIILVLVRVLYYCNLQIGIIAVDTPSYADYDISLGARTPGYPLIIDLCQMVLGEKYNYGVFLIQCIVSFISLIYLYRCIIMILYSKDWKDIEEDGPRKDLARVLCLLYGVNPVLVRWDVYILTESLAVSFTIFFIYQCLKIVLAGGVKWGILAAITVVVCPSIKTALFIYAFDLFVLLLLMTVFEKERRKELCICLGACAGSFVFLAIWIFIIHYYTGLWSFATYIVKHQLVKALQTGLYKNYPDKGIVEAINLIISETDLPVYDWKILTPVYDLIGGGYPEKLRFANDCLNTDRKGFFLFQLRTILEAATTSYVGGTYIVAILSLACLIYKWIREKKCPYILLGISGGMISIYVSVFWGSYGPWGRLLIYIVPFVFCGIAAIIAELYNLRASHRIHY